MSDGLTHVDRAGHARMVVVSGKDVTARSACATGRVRLSAAAVAALRAGKVPKGDALAVARTADRTGVEMEALTSVSVAALALIDMVKAIDPAAVITDVRVEWKEGGKTGPWHR